VGGVAAHLLVGQDQESFVGQPGDHRLGDLIRFDDVHRAHHLGGQRRVLAVLPRGKQERCANPLGAQARAFQ
jgi:hypothetical protein